MEIARTIEVEIETKIRSELQQLASQEQITILYACESGSRAWGFRPDILTEIDRLLKLKAISNEATTIPVSPLLNDFQAEIDKCELAIKLIPKHEIDPQPLNDLFKQYALTQS